MRLADDEQPISTYYFRGQTDSKNTSVLTNRRLVVIYKSVEESYPLSKITAVKVSFQRSALFMILGVCSLCLTLWLGVYGAEAANKIDSIVTQMQESTEKDQSGFLEQGQNLQTALSICKWIGLPFMFFASIYLIYFGWRGYTAIVITYFAGEKTYGKTGRDAKLMEFAHLVSHQLR